MNKHSAGYTKPTHTGQVMSDYPDIEKEVPAWHEIEMGYKILDRLVAHPSDVYTGLAQFIRAVVREDWPHIDALGNELPKFIRKTVREMPMPEYMGEMWTREGIDNAHRRLTKIEVELDDIKRRVPPDPALAERLAGKAASAILPFDDNMAREKKLLPFFQEAVRRAGEEEIADPRIDQIRKRLIAVQKGNMEYKWCREYIDRQLGEILKIMKAVEGKGGEA